MTTQEEDFLTENDRSVVQLRPITGGKQPPKRGKNWLRDLDQWTVFLARVLNPPNCECFVFQIRVKYGNACELLCFMPKEQQPHVRYFSMEHFSNDYELTEILDDGTTQNVDTATSIPPEGGIA